MNRNYTNLLLASVFVLLASCATLSDEEKYERADQLAQAQDQYKLKQISCKNAGGYMWISMTSTKPTRDELWSAKCVRRNII